MPKTLEKPGVKKPAAATKEELEVAAYYHWIGRGCPPNDDLTDWVEVEKELVKPAHRQKSHK